MSACATTFGKLTSPEDAMTRFFTQLLCLSVVMQCAAAQTVDGKRQYQARCAGCHGEDGTGGGHGPGIVNVRRPRATSREAVRNVILKGIPDGGMPAFAMPEREADAIAAFVM